MHCTHSTSNRACTHLCGVTTYVHAAPKELCQPVQIFINSCLATIAACLGCRFETVAGLADCHSSLIILGHGTVCLNILHKAQQEHSEQHTSRCERAKRAACVCVADLHVAFGGRAWGWHIT